MRTSFLARAAAAAWVVGLLLSAPPPALAGDCFSDPVYERNEGATVTTGARVRDVACMEGSVVKTTLAVGTRVTIIAETDGWYKVRTTAGLEGWVGQWLLSVGGEPPALTVPPTSLEGSAGPAASPTATAPPVTNVQPLPTAGLIRGVSTRAVYLLHNGKRYAFPTERVYLSWYANFNAVVVVSDADLATVPLAGNVTYRPGIRLVKLQTDNRVFAVGRYGVLRHIASEVAARELYGDVWATFVDDILDISFGNYLEGADISSSSDFDRTTESEINEPAENIRPEGFDDTSM
ncbi:SH3 domain-containing protein [Patescibacteria group bacterium]|nr:MAG: SH3 domain-containing protein [Patescibacteria group bacterium]